VVIIREDEQIGGIVGSTSSAGTLDDTSAALGQVAKDQITNFAATGATSGIGILKKTGSCSIKS
jgi:type IV pilus assembly protein PilQ